MIRISVIVPVYNCREFLAEALESLWQQTYKNLEIIVLDAGSTDGTVDFVTQNRNRITHFISEPDRGQSDAINKGLALASGELFSWLNGDDILFPNCLSAVAEAYVQNACPGIIQTNVVYINHLSQVFRWLYLPPFSRFFFLHGVWASAAPCIFFQTDLVRYVGGLDPDRHLSMDLDLWVRLFRAGVRVVHLPEFQGAFRWHQDSKTVTARSSRKTFENPETTEILNAFIPASSHSRRQFWRLLFRLSRFLQGNYFRELLEKGRYPSMPHWKEIYSLPEANKR